MSHAPIEGALLDAVTGLPRLIEDVEAWWRWRNRTPSPMPAAFATLYHSFPEFRSVAHYRFRQAKADLALLPQGRLTNDLYLVCPEIGGGLRVQHGHSTWVMADRIGRNFLVNQNVTIGVARGGRPTIGNRVRICTGAVVVGPITIGDDVVIAPNAVVDFDVPNGRKVFPARSVIV